MDSFLDSFFHDAVSTAGSAAMLGLLFHQAIRMVEFELYMFHFMGASVASYFGLIYSFIQFGGHSVPSAFARASLFATSFNATLLTSIAVYRLVFHRCRSFSGPFGAKLTRFYATYLSSKKVQYYKDLAEMHATYGDFVRTGESYWLVVPVENTLTQH